MLSTPAVARAQVSLNNQPHLLLLEQKLLRAVCGSSTCFPDESLHMQRSRWLQENFHLNQSDSWKHDVSSLHRKILNYFRQIERPNRNNRNSGGMTMLQRPWTQTHAVIVQVTNTPRGEQHCAK